MILYLGPHAREVTDMALKMLDKTLITPSNHLIPAKRRIKSPTVAFRSAAVTKAGLSNGRVWHSLVSVSWTEIYSPL